MVDCHHRHTTETKQQCKIHAHRHGLYINTTNKTKQKRKIVTQNCEQQQELRRQCQLAPPSGEPASCTRTNDRRRTCTHTHRPCCRERNERTKRQHQAGVIAYLGKNTVSTIVKSCNSKSRLGFVERLVMLCPMPS